MPPTAIDVAVTSALEIGYRHIDTAFTYGNEEAIGKVLKKWFDKGGKREDIFITTKLPPYGMQPSMIKSYLKLSLEKLNLQYVNMYLIHKPFAFVKDKYKYEAAKYENGSVMLDLEANHLLIWKEMEKLVKAGLTRSIGLSNFNESQLLNIYHNSEIKPSNLQIELQAYNQQRPMRRLCAEYSITVTAFSTLGSPGSSGDKRTKLSQSLPRLLDNPKVSIIAERHNRTAAQVLLRHAVQNGIVVLPKSTHPERIKRNIEIFDFSLTDAEIEELNNLDKGERGRIFNFLGDKGVEKHPQYPFASQLKYENVSVNVH
ncbi:PREDICTED: alcohol dehydrogenase [NADP(+)]-like [Ceratosolen solmsi marchali]|uniref:Alcohol dehydrogenase [NADP(+)]-like n=1 Tax=Ceratosolen solmsi marchali TaxID=326594 RepID=A0AAJ6YND6_9HYME|nr:PREDICTED: alcohol dehydrogenase [NADP(+)]-like [Ceratosolen solmsi marchali]